MATNKNEQKQNHIPLFGSLVLVLAALSASRILIYNEELLVALAFGAFVTFCFQKLGNDVSETLDSRKNSIHQQIDACLQIQVENVSGLYDQHLERVQLKKDFKNLQLVLCQQLLQLSEGRNLTLNAQLTAQISAKLHAFQTIKTTSQGFLQETLAFGFRLRVLEGFQKSKKKIQSSLLKDALSNLNSKNL